MILRLILVMAESAFRVSSLQETVARMLRRVEQSPVSRSCALRPGCAPCRKLSPGCYDGSSRAQQADPLRPGCTPCRKLSPGCYDESSRAQQSDRAVNRS
ncbi:uncharacterized protein LOC26526114 isoform X4 [Drosophila erecta]|uniref:uncharacterized protein LOC113564134 isoform X4 n=1 Tax=Drosophila erecta TaxID=7220 RepID=UPI000F050EE7|nr:uncharacterized protein LOC113564134 isoform X4 [Drosophila erecta]XP_026835248.1 uncharacterized protein LOC26526114 isoform X4 [Drosophila erecta]